MPLDSATITALEVDNSADTSATVTALEVDESIQENVMSHLEVTDPVQDSTKTSLVGDSSCTRVAVTNQMLIIIRKLVIHYKLTVQEKLIETWN